MGCKKCRGADEATLQRVDSFERISLADDPGDANCGHYYIDVVYVMRCTACGHRQERLEKRSPFPTLREAQKELDALAIGKG